jgi:Toprim domain
MIGWHLVERITQGRLGRTLATCPLCSSKRRSLQHRRAKVLAVNLVEPDFAIYFCNHCAMSGHSRPDTPGRIVNLAEQSKRRQEAERLTAADKQERSRRALALWSDAQPFQGSPAETYLRTTRGIGDWLDQFPTADTFRFHPDCPFEKQCLPCMIALVRDIRSNAPVAIHRTALTTENPPQRISRLSLGPIGGGAIKISPHADVSHGLMIGEGVETVLSASRQFQFRPIWSVIDKNGVAKFPILPGIECITIAVDNDQSGDGQRAAGECVKRLVRAGVECIEIKPNLHKDMNDLLRQQINIGTGR